MSLSATISAWLLVLVCAVSGAYCLLRARRPDGAAAGEAVMGFGMALMAVPLGQGGGWRGPVLGAVFCGAALHAVWLLRGGAHHAHHLVGSLTMVYMTLSAGSGSASGHGVGAGHGGGGLPLLTGALLLYYAGYVVLGGTRLIPAGPAATALRGMPVAAAPRGALRSAEVTRACRLAMGMGMLAMLLTM